MIMINKGKDIAEVSDFTNFGQSQIFALKKQYWLSGITTIQDKRKKSPME